MKKGKGKSKGGAFERLMCKEMSLWLSDGKRKDLFWRSAGSGSRATVSRGEVRTGVGDISSVHPDSGWFTARFAVELKHYRALKIVSCLLYRSKGKQSLKGFWKEIRKKAKVARLDPILIARENGRPTILCYHSQGLFGPIVRASGVSPIMSEKSLGISVCLWDDFKAKVRVHDIKRAANR